MRDDVSSLVKSLNELYREKEKHLTQIHTIQIELLHDLKNDLSADIDYKMNKINNLIMQTDILDFDISEKSETLFKITGTKGPVEKLGDITEDADLKILISKRLALKKCISDLYLSQNRIINLLDKRMVECDRDYNELKRVNRIKDILLRSTDSDSK